MPVCKVSRSRAIIMVLSLSHRCHSHMNHLGGQCHAAGFHSKGTSTNAIHKVPIGNASHSMLLILFMPAYLHLNSRFPKS